MELKNPNQIQILEVDQSIDENGLQLNLRKDTYRKKGIMPDDYMTVREHRKWKKLSPEEKDKLYNRSLHSGRDNNSDHKHIFNQQKRNILQKEKGFKNQKKVRNNISNAVNENTKKVVDATRNSIEAGTTAAVTVGTGGANLPVKTATKAAKKTAKRFRQIIERSQKQTESNIERMQQQARERMSSNPRQSTSDHLKYVYDKFLAVIASPVMMAGAAAGYIFISLIFVVLAIFVAFLLPSMMIIVVLITLIQYGTAAQTGGQAIVQVAQRELQQSVDNVGGNKYKIWYGMDDNWCNMFVSWCANECGFLDLGIMPRTASVGSSMDFYMARDQFQRKESGYKPKPGDLIIFKTGASHIGIVVEYDPETDVITTIEGNTGSSSTSPYHKGSKVMKRTYPSDYSTITGYGTPAYPADMSLSDSVFEVIRNIFYAIETGGQVYGKADYADVTPAYANTSNETAITIGAGGWFATEAQSLLKLIRSTSPTTFEALDTAGISSDLDTEDWQYYNVSPNSAKGQCIKKIISSTVGIQCQNEMMNEQINEYLQAASAAGVKDIDGQVMYAEIMHLGGKPAADRILRLAQKPYTAETIYNAVKSGGTGYQVNAPIFRSRHDCVYKWINQYLIPAQDTGNKIYDAEELQPAA